MSYQSAAAAAGVSPSKKNDGDKGEEEGEEKRPAREGDPLLPGGRSQSTSYATTTNTHLDSQRLRARRTSKSPPIGYRGTPTTTQDRYSVLSLGSAPSNMDNNNNNDNNNPSRRADGIFSATAAAAAESRTPAAAAAAAATSHDEQNEDDDQSGSLLSGQQNQPSGHHSQQNSMTSLSVTPALPGNDGESIKSYQHGGGGGGGDTQTVSSGNDDNSTLQGSSTTAQQYSVSTANTGGTSSAATGAAVSAAGEQQQSYHHFSSSNNNRSAAAHNNNNNNGGGAADADNITTSTSIGDDHHAPAHDNSTNTNTSSVGSNQTNNMSASTTMAIQQQERAAQEAAERQAGFQKPSAASGGTGRGPSSSRSADLKQQQQLSQQQQQYRGGGGSFPRASSPGADSRSVGSSGGSQPPLLEIPEEIYAVRKAALKVLKPLTKTWIVISVGLALTVLFGMARWTRLLPGIPFWFILLPSWSAHVGLLWLHVLSARALSGFIAEANDSRQRADSRDHLNRTEYLPLLQRSLKFGLKTGLLSFFVFIFEILIFIRLARNSISLNAAFVPLWILISGGILDGFICRTQHFLRVICWLLTFAGMVLLVLKVDYDCNAIRWRVVVSPVVAVLSIASANLIYIVYGHQIGYYRLTEAQLTAGNLYSLAALICIILVVMIGEVIPLSRPVEVETRLFVVILAPLVVCLVGMGAWVVSRDEFGRLLLYGGQAAVHPMKLRWESKGWTSVQGKGVTVIPMFGEVSFRPLERRRGHGLDSNRHHNGGSINSRNSKRHRSSTADRFVELCVCCPGGGHCYPYEEDEEEETDAANTGTGGGGDVEGGRSNGVGGDDIGYHPYLDPSPSRSSRHAYDILRGA